MRRCMKLAAFSVFGSACVLLFGCPVATFLGEVEQKLVEDCVFIVRWKKFGTPVCWLALFKEKRGARESLQIPI